MRLRHLILVKGLVAVNQNHSTRCRRKPNHWSALVKKVPRTFKLILFYFIYLFIAFRVSRVDEAKCIVVTRVCLCVCLSATACLQYCTHPDVTWGTVGAPPSCASLGGFAIRARVALLRQHSANAKCQRVLVLALGLV